MSRRSISKREAGGAGLLTGDVTACCGRMAGLVGDEGDANAGGGAPHEPADGDNITGDWTATSGEGDKVRPAAEEEKVDFFVFGLLPELAALIPPNNADAISSFCFSRSLFSFGAAGAKLVPLPS